MARALFICEVVLDSANRAYPAVLDVRAANGNFPCVWTITKYQDARRTAVGLAEVTNPQLSAMQADTRIRAVGLPANWLSITWGDIAVATRNNIITFLNNRGVNTDDLADLLAGLPDTITKISGKFRAGRTFQHMESELIFNFNL